MAIRFVSSRAIEFAMLSGPWAENRERLKVSGDLLTQQDALYNRDV